METIITGQTSTSQSQIPSIPTNANCTLSGETINHGSSITTYNETSILWNAVYSCDDRKITRTCNNGVLDGSGAYIYTSCIKGVVNNCSASGGYVNNSHTYNIPTITHNTSTGNILSSTVNENNGQFKYTLTSIECNDGNYTNITENPTGTVQSCDSGYGINGNSCSASQNGVCNNSVALGCTTGNAISDNGQTTCGTTRTWNCNGLYGGSNSVQCSFNNGACRGEQLYTTPGTYTWTVPTGITSVSVVCVGGGGSAGYSSNGNPGGNSSFTAGFGTITAGGGGISVGGTKIGGDGGGSGGNGGNSGQYGHGGGGAGGYSGNGGNGSIYSGAGTNGTGGGGGGGGVAGGGGSGGGGGVGLFGQGPSGTGGGSGGGGGNGSNGSNGTDGGWGNYGGGGSYGGGGAGGYNPGTVAGGGGALVYKNNISVLGGNSYNVVIGAGGIGTDGGGGGGNGACRIIRPGTTRQFPSTDVGP